MLKFLSKILGLFKGLFRSDPKVLLLTTVLPIVASVLAQLIPEFAKSMEDGKLDKLELERLRAAAVHAVLRALDLDELATQLGMSPEKIAAEVAKLVANATNKYKAD